MSLLTPSELNQFQSDILPFLGSTAIIERPFDTTDSQGGYVRAFTAIGTVPARVEPITRMSLTEVPVSRGERIAALKMWLVILPARTNIKPIDKVSIFNTQYEVIGVRSPRTDEIICKCECELLDIGGVAVAS